MITLNFFIKSKNWPSRLKKIKTISRKVVKESRSLKFNNKIDYYLNIILTNDKDMKKIHIKYKNVKKTTDVLTFVSEIKKTKFNKKKYCDIFFCAEIIDNYAKRNKIDFYEHFTHLLVHSFLHINGYLHKKKVDFQRMKKIEIIILERLGLQNPYII